MVAAGGGRSLSTLALHSLTLSETDDSLLEMVEREPEGATFGSDGRAIASTGEVRFRGEVLAEADFLQLSSLTTLFLGGELMRETEAESSCSVAFGLPS